MSRIVAVILIYHCHKPIASINLLSFVAETCCVSRDVRTEFID
jgi:hypothetical protein